MKRARSGLTGPQTRVHCARCGREVWGDAVDANQTAICTYCAMVVGGKWSVEDDD